jgi:thymidylate kinase
MSSSRGIFILFEGLDRTGKSTQCKMLADKLNGNEEQKAVHLRFPGKTKAHKQNQNQMNLLEIFIFGLKNIFYIQI